MAQSVWSRSYLKGLGYNDGDIGYDGENKTLTLKNKPLLSGVTPNSEGKAMVDQSQLKQALNINDRNEALQQYRNNINKPVQPFSYDMNSIKSDPLYTAGLESLQKDAQTATNQALVNLGRRGIGNSQSAVTSANAQQQNVVNQANTKLAPQVIAQRYQQYLDANAQQDKQNQNLLGYANALNGLNQQDVENERATNQQALQNRQANLSAYLQAGQALGYSPVDGPKEDWRLLFQSPDSNPEAFTQNLTGRQLTNNEQQQDFQRQLQEAGVTGMYNNNPTMQKLAQDFGQNAENQRIALSAQGQAQSAANQSASLGLQQQRFDWERDPNNPDNIYKQAQSNKLNNDGTTQNTKQFESEVVSNLKNMSPDMRKKFFDQEQQTIVGTLGVAGYNRLFNQYFDKYGDPK